MLQNCPDDMKVEIHIEQYNKRYPVACVPAGFQYPVAINNSRNVLQLTASLNEGEYVKINKDKQGIRID